MRRVIIAGVIIVLSVLTAMAQLPKEYDPEAVQAIINRQNQRIQALEARLGAVSTPSSVVIISRMQPAPKKQGVFWLDPQTGILSIYGANSWSTPFLLEAHDSDDITEGSTHLFLAPGDLDLFWDYTFLAGYYEWTNQPAALTEIPSQNRISLDLTYADSIRMISMVSVAGAAGSYIKFQYRIGGGAWNSLTALTCGMASTGMKSTGWEGVPPGAQTEIGVRVVGANGDGAADPVLSNISLQVKNY